jgi:ADP-heptose:LPS heptosyltransferase
MKKVSADLRRFVESIGVTIKEGTELTRELIPELADAVNTHMAQGHDAKERLKAQQSYSMDADTTAMGFQPPKPMCETIEEFKEQAPAFVIAKALSTCKLKSPWGHETELKKDKEYCVTAGVYRQMNQGHLVLAPAERKFSDVYKAYNGESLDYKTICVWREGGIGDILFIRPILCHLKRKYPTCRVIFGTKKIYHEMVSLWEDAIDDLHSIPFACEDTLDVADYHLSFMGVIEHTKTAERIDVHDLFARYAGLDPDEIDWCQPMKSTSNNMWFHAAPAQYAVVQPRSSSPIRTPNTATAVAAVNAITATGTVCVIADSPHQGRAVDDIKSLCDRQEMVISFARFTRHIQDVVRLITNARLVVSPDSACVHIAAMQETPCIGIYGPFAASTRTERYPLCDTIEPSRSDCCPAGGKHCFTHSHKRCEYFEGCWSNLDNAKLAEMITNKLETT